MQFSIVKTQTNRKAKAYTSQLSNLSTLLKKEKLSTYRRILTIAIKSMCKLMANNYSYGTVA